MNRQKVKLADIKRVVLKKGLWKERMDVFANKTIPDVLDKFEKDKGGVLSNYRQVVNNKKGKHVGHAFYDGLINETMRGVSDFMARQYDRTLDQRLDQYIALMAEAQAASGDDYLNTFTSTNFPNCRWGTNGGNLLWFHDLYNTGAVVEAGVHHYRATGKTNLLNIAVRLANHVTRVIGPIPGVNIVPAHSLPEEAYLKLYTLFKEEPDLKEKIEVPVNEEDYLNLVKYWLDHRGRHEDRKSYPRYLGEYAQDHAPILQQSEAVGHAVRAGLLYTGIAEYANITGDADYAAAARRLWENIVQRKMHISGAIGALQNEEKFGYEYQLPEKAYLETCANIALMFFARAMFVHNGEGEYMDILERALYNGVLVGVSIKGDEYFYRNPLLSDGDEKRWIWHDCPCCPPMFLKAMGEMPSYIYGTDNEGVFVNLYMASQVELPYGNSRIVLSQETNFPWEDVIHITVEECPAESFNLRLRVPYYSGNFGLLINGETITVPEIKKGYVSINRPFKPGDKITVMLDIKPVCVAAHPYVWDVQNKVALQYGPLLYCIEEADNSVKDVVVPENYSFTLVPSNAYPGGKDIVFEDIWYRQVRAVPYFAWGNREQGFMKVWLPAENFKTAPAGQWETDLYRPYKK